MAPKRTQRKTPVSLKKVPTDKQVENLLLKSALPRDGTIRASQSTLKTINSLLEKVYLEPTETFGEYQLTEKGTKVADWL